MATRAVGALELKTPQNIFTNLTGLKVSKFSFPGLKRRDKRGNFVMLITACNGIEYILSFRSSLKLASVEEIALRNLSKESAPVPKLINRTGSWLLQEYISGPRLSEVLGRGKLDQSYDILETAISSLLQIQDLARKIGLGKHMKPICNSHAWRNERTGWLTSLADVSNSSLPKLNEEQINSVLTVKPTSFVKWDARPGNAILTKNAKVIWFDWEHCGCRAGIDDLIWFLTDEWLNLSSISEEKIISEYITNFSESELCSSREQYMWVFGTIQMCGKLFKILNQKKIKSGWVDRDFCLQFEQMGVTLRESRTLASKIIRWSSRDKLTAPISGWMQNIYDQLPES